MVKKKILPWLSVSALIFALPVNAAENNTFMANTPDMYTTEKYIEKREKKYEVMSVTSACVIAAGMYAKYRTRKQIFAKYLTGGKNNEKKITSCLPLSVQQQQRHQDLHLACHIMYLQMQQR